MEAEIDLKKLVPEMCGVIDIEWSFETIQQLRHNMCILYRAFIYHVENYDSSRSPYVYSGIVYNTWINQNRCESDWVFN